MGSRYGGLKQLDGVGPHGETIMDYSIHDAIKAGFGKVVFVIRKDFEKDFNEKILSKYRDHIPVEVAFQSLDDLPEGFSMPEGRVKPWGTGHAIRAARDVISEPFAVINADDYYGSDAFRVMAEYLQGDEIGNDYCMVGFPVGNTLSDSGSVSRGVCTVGRDGNLQDIVECHGIMKNDIGDIAFDDEAGITHVLRSSTPVSMNLWGFMPDYFQYTEREFLKFLATSGKELKSEFYIPSVVDALIESGEKKVKVLHTDSQWFGVTYPEDRPKVVECFKKLHADGVYPDQLF